MEATIGNSPVTTGNGWVCDTNMQSFMKDVIQPSVQQPVLVFFWSPRSPSCKEFNTLLEKAVNAAKGSVLMARVDIDTQPQMAAQFRIQSVPTTYVFVQGQPLDAFAGALPEAQLMQIIGKLSGQELETDNHEEMLAHAKSLWEAGDIKAARNVYEALHAEMPENKEVTAGLARCLISEGLLDEADALLQKAGATNDAAISAAKAALTLARSGSGDMKALAAELENNPDDFQTRLELANAQFIAGKQEEALDNLITIIRKDREWNEQAARKLLLQFFEVLGPTNPLTMTYRRKLSTLLFS